MTCPSCASPMAVQTPVGGVTICETCLVSVAEDGTRATEIHTRALSSTQLAALRTRRKQARAAQPVE